uniref:Uncharacterized protein n=1 Tax=Megaselia scalaris TaxID=36166 RepID=T1GIX6_MEGSC
MKEIEYERSSNASNTKRTHLDKQAGNPHVMLEQLAAPPGEQQKTMKYGRQLLIKRNLIEGSSSHTYNDYSILGFN